MTFKHDFNAQIEPETRTINRRQSLLLGAALMSSGFAMPALFGAGLAEPTDSLGCAVSTGWFD
jgi:ABC-type cobalamin transport system permease subunit